MYAHAMSPPSAKSARFVEQTSDGSERTYAVFNHLVGLMSAFDGMGVLGFVGALIMWRIKNEESHFLDDHGREAVNFQLSLLLYVIVGAIPSAGLIIVFVVVLRMVGCIRGAIAAGNGEYYRYPMCIRFLKGPSDA